MIFRPYGIVLNGLLELGLELVIEAESRLLRPHTGKPDEFVLSPAFANAHSHLEYFGLQNLSESGRDYWTWISELTGQKSAQSLPEVETDCLVAAKLNRATGVCWIEEHSDRPFAGAALAAVGLRGRIYQEVITLFEANDPVQKLASIKENALQNAWPGGTVLLNPHAPQTVDQHTLQRFGNGDFGSHPISIHVVESPIEREFFEFGTGPIARMYEHAGIPPPATGVSPLQYLDDLKLLTSNTQAVHCCDIRDDEIELLRLRGTRVAHCPRSNENLGCPVAPVRRMLEAGIEVGIGLDSAASSGPIDMFAEMRTAISSSVKKGEPLISDQVWKMAEFTSILESNCPLIKIHVPGARNTNDLLANACPGLVEHVRI